MIIAHDEFSSKEIIIIFFCRIPTWNPIPWSNTQNISLKWKYSSCITFHTYRYTELIFSEWNYMYISLFKKCYFFQSHFSNRLFWANRIKGNKRSWIWKSDFYNLWIRWLRDRRSQWGNRHLLRSKFIYNTIFLWFILNILFCRIIYRWNFSYFSYYDISQFWKIFIEIPSRATCHTKISMSTNSGYHYLLPSTRFTTVTFFHP